MSIYDYRDEFDFYDGDHMSPETAIKVSKLFAEKIINLK